MDTEQWWQELRATFKQELDDHVQSLNTLLLRLEQSSGEERPALVDALFREAHSLKGAARAVDFGSIERVAHALESALGAARQGIIPADNWYDTAYRAVDLLVLLYRANVAGQDPPPELEAIIRDLDVEAAATSADAVPPAESAAPPVPPAGSAAPPLAPARRAAPGKGARNGHAQTERAPHVPPTVDKPPSGPSPKSQLPSAPSAPEVVAATDRIAVPDSASPPGPIASPVASGMDLTPSADTDRVRSSPAARRTSPAASPRADADSVRVAVSKLDALFSQAGELAVTEIRIEQRLRELQELSRALERWRREWQGVRLHRTTLSRAAPSGTRTRDGRDRALEALLRFNQQGEEQARAMLQSVDDLITRFRQDTAQLAVVARAIDEEVLSIRLLPIATIFTPLERLVRDLAHATGKEVQLVLEGGEAEVDRRVLEQLRDPLLHMIRNAVDHGIESPDERRRQGKDPVGRIHLSAARRGDTIQIELADDGVGLHPAELRAAAIRKGLVLPEHAAALDDRAALELIFLPGLSTAGTVTDTSGRGVGMDVVRENVARIDGRIDVASEPGQGTRFTITVPLTMATTRAVVLEQGTGLLAIPSAAVERNVRVRPAEIVSVQGRRIISIDGHPIPLVELGIVLEQGGAAPDDAGLHTWWPLVVLRQGERRVALRVDRLIGEEEVVVKRLGWPLLRVRNVAGAAVLGSGETVVVLNPADVLKSALNLVHGGRLTSTPTAARLAARLRSRLLVVDDSVTTRTLERSILEAAGYDVAVAMDGAEALHVLRRETIDLVVSDIEMPNLDGFELTDEMRRDEKLRAVPVILVTSLEAPEHRERGVAVGADAYIVKAGFDQAQLLDAIRRLLGPAAR